VRFAERLAGGDDEAGPFVAAGDELEEQVGGFGLERDVAGLVDDQERASRASSACSFPAAQAAASRSAHCDAVANRTRCPAWQARIAIPVARWVLPVPGGPRNTT
jgi:hypothetical protein